MILVIEIGMYGVLVMFDDVLDQYSLDLSRKVIAMS